MRDVHFYGPPRPIRRRASPGSRTPTHILAWRYEAEWCWRVTAMNERGEAIGEPEEHLTRARMISGAGRLAKQTGAAELVIIDGTDVRKLPYNHRSA